jgi:hypothetical protein
MNRDPIPTFRRAARVLRRAATSRRVWKGLRNVVIGGIVAGIVGWFGAVKSRSACEAHTRKTITGYFAAKLDPEWLDESLLYAVPFPRDLLDSDVYESEARSMFRPEITYRAAPPQQPLPENRSTETWAYVKSRVVLPFIVRAHYGWGYSIRLESRGIGTWMEGVRTYACAFGLVFPINDWAVGATAHF